MSGLVSLFSGNVNAQTPCKGALVVNEFSNGARGNQEFVEIIVGSCGTCVESTVDISHWIIDDNNGIFTTNPAVAGSNLGISGGHLRLTNDAFWKNFSRGYMIVLFNGVDFKQSNPDFVAATAPGVVGPTGTGYYQNGSAIFIAVGLSRLVERKTTLPIVGGTSTSANYCDANLYTVDSFAWNTIGIRNGRLGDGIQVRCPGCTSGLGEPSFYHGASYGDTTFHVSNPSFLDGAHVAFAAGDTIGGTGRSFQFSIGTNPGADAGWVFVDTTLESPGISNSDDNQLFQDLVSEGSISFNCCPEPVIDTTPAKGSLIITEVSNGPSGSCEYVELLVAACGGSSADSVDIRGWIIDDNSGNFNTTRTCITGVGISSGHLRFAYNDVWKKVPVGSVIVIFNGAENCYNFVDDTADNNHNGVYFIKAGSNPYVERTTTKPSTTDCGYCRGVYAVGTTANSWNTVGLGNDKDAMQVRCPGCTDEIPGGAEFYHGFGYGSGFSGFAAGTSDLGGAYITGSGATRTYEFFQGNQPGVSANWRSVTAAAAGTGTNTTAGVVFAAFKDSVVAGLYNFPCCGSLGKAGASSTPFDNGTTSTGLIKNEVKQGSAAMYPNPAGDLLNIDINRAAAFEVTIVDLMGKVVYKNTYAATQGTTTLKLDMSGLSNGVYIYNITSLGNEEALSGRLMIKK